MAKMYLSREPHNRFRATITTANGKVVAATTVTARPNQTPGEIKAAAYKKLRALAAEFNEALASVPD